MKTICLSRYDQESGADFASALPNRLGRIKLNLAGSRSGRILLHAACLCRNPARAQWHWRGVVRELVAI